MMKKITVVAQLDKARDSDFEYSQLADFMRLQGSPDGVRSNKNGTETQQALQKSNPEEQSTVHICTSGSITEYEYGCPCVADCSCACLSKSHLSLLVMFALK